MIHLEDIKTVRFQWSESGLINDELGNDEQGDINVDVDAAKADDLIARAAKCVSSGYDKTPLTITLNDGTVWCHKLKYYIVRETKGLLDLIKGDNE